MKNIKTILFIIFLVAGIILFGKYVNFKDYIGNNNNENIVDANDYENGVIKYVENNKNSKTYYVIGINGNTVTLFPASKVENNNISSKYYERYKLVNDYKIYKNDLTIGNDHGEETILGNDVEILTIDEINETAKWIHYDSYVEFVGKKVAQIIMVNKTTIYKY